MSVRNFLIEKQTSYASKRPQQNAHLLWGILGIDNVILRVKELIFITISGRFFLLKKLFLSTLFKRESFVSNQFQISFAKFLIERTYHTFRRHIAHISFNRAVCLSEEFLVDLLTWKFQANLQTLKFRDLSGSNWCDWKTMKSNDNHTCCDWWCLLAWLVLISWKWNYHVYHHLAGWLSRVTVSKNLQLTILWNPDDEQLGVIIDDQAWSYQPSHQFRWLKLIRHLKCVGW